MKKKTILVADDEPFIRNIICEILSQEFNMITAENGEEALAKIKSAKPSLIVLDIDMPKMTGHQVCKVLRSDKDIKHIPVIMLTVRGKVSDVDEGFEKGADAYIVKPFNPQQLESKIREILTGEVQ